MLLLLKLLLTLFFLEINTSNFTIREYDAIVDPIGTAIGDEMVRRAHLINCMNEYKIISPPVIL